MHNKSKVMNMKIFISIFSVIIFPLLGFATNPRMIVEHETNEIVINSAFIDTNKSGDENNVNNRANKSNIGIWGYLKSKWIELVGLLIAFLAFFLPIYRYIAQKREEQRDKRFVTYHKLIKDLVQPDSNGRIMLDRQIATAFEFRNFPSYFDITKRILSDLKKSWENIPENQRIVTELNLTIAYIDNENRWYNKIFRYLKIKR